MNTFIRTITRQLPNARASGQALQLRGEYLFETFIIPQAIGRNIPTPIFVGNGAFKTCKSSDDMRTAILYNEGTHTRQMYLGSLFYKREETQNINIDLLKTVNELESSLNVLVAIKRYNIPVSPGFNRIDEIDYADYYAKLTSWKPANETEKSIIEKAKKYFPKPKTLLTYSSN